MLWGYSEPATIGERLLRAGVPTSPDALKVDIDSTDLPTLRAVLASGFRPKVLMVEINPDIPPPFSWHVARAPLPSREPAMWTSGYYGTSAEAVYHACAEAGLALLGFEIGSDIPCRPCEHNAWFVDASLLRAQGAEPPSWEGMTRAFWRAHYAQAMRNHSLPPTTWKPSCLHQRHCALTLIHPLAGPGACAAHHFNAPATPPSGLHPLGSGGLVAPSTWTDWAHLSQLLATPAAAPAASAFARRLQQLITPPWPCADCVVDVRATVQPDAPPRDAKRTCRWRPTLAVSALRPSHAGTAGTARRNDADDDMYSSALKNPLSLLLRLWRRFVKAALSSE